MKFDPAAPYWPDRDRFVLSAGHGSMLQYALHYLVGYPDMTIDEIKRFRQLGAKTAGHPEYGHALGVETTTGPLGQGLATAVGMAIAERALAARFGAELVDHYTYVIAGDGCLMEGVSQEAIDLAGHLKLSRLIVLWDDNKITIDGATALSTEHGSTRALRGLRLAHPRGRRARFGARSKAALDAAKTQSRPTLIACRTTIGFGAPGKQGIGGDPWRAARRSRDRGGAGQSGLAVAALRDSRGLPRRLAGRRPARRAAARTVGGAARRAARSANASRAALSGEIPRSFRRAWPITRPGLVAKAPQCRHAQGFGNGARGDQRRDPDDARRLGRPHPFEPDDHQGHGVARRQAISRAATCATASANSAWRRR